MRNEGRDQIFGSLMNSMADFQECIFFENSSEEMLFAHVQLTGLCCSID